ncbi:MAG: DUF3500 domain-containing protein [Planctomycetota bacterium]
MHWRALLAFGSLLLVGCAAAPGSGPDPAVADVAASTRAFLAALPAELRERACRPFADTARTAWHFVPGRYDGVEFGALDAAAMERAQALLRTLLSPAGHAKTMAIVQLENVLRELEGRSGRDVSHRDPGRYALLVCGEPDAAGTFAVRLQGHHVSLHFTFADGLLVGATPHFLGSNPHEQREGPAAHSRVLAEEENLVRALLTSLDAAQQVRTLLSATAPPEVFLDPAASFAQLGPPAGLPASAMTEAQRDLLWRLIEVFAHHLRGEFAAQELARLQPQFADATFAWAGGFERDEGHYWRIQGRTFAIEYDNTQNNANHVHTVWRDLERDFGGDLLRQHHASEHRQGR